MSGQGLGQDRGRSPGPMPESTPVSAPGARAEAAAGGAVAPSWQDRLEALALRVVAGWAARASERGRRRAAQLVGWVALDLLRVRADHVLGELRHRLGLAPEAARDLRRRVYGNFFENALEAATLPSRSADDLLAAVEATGLTHLRAALAGGRGAIIVSGHYGCWELVPSWLARQGFRVAIVVRRQRNPLVDAFMERMRRAHGATTVDSGFGLREILRSLRSGCVLALMVDQDAGTQGLAVPFLGAPASTVVGPAQIALKTGAPIVPLILHRRPGRPHHLEIRPPIDPAAYRDLPADVARFAITEEYTRCLEHWVRAHPDQWFWLHRRWKHGDRAWRRPDGVAVAAPPTVQIPEVQLPAKTTGRGGAR